MKHLGCDYGGSMDKPDRGEYLQGYPRPNVH